MDFVSYALYNQNIYIHQLFIIKKHMSILQEHNKKTRK